MKFGLTVRDLWISDDLKQAMNEFVSTSPESKPGVLRKKDDWYFLTYLRIIKVKNFDPELWDVTTNEINSIRAVKFKIINNRLYVQGTKVEISEITYLLDALALRLGGREAQENPADFQYTDYYKLTDIDVDLMGILTKLEEKQEISDIKKLKVRKVSINLGEIRNASIDTTDYGGSREAIENQGETGVTGLEATMKNFKKVSIYFGTDATIRVTASAEDDINLEKTAQNYSEYL